MKNKRFKLEYGFVALLLVVDAICIVETNAAWRVISYSGVGIVFLLLGLVTARQTWRLRSIWTRYMLLMDAATSAVLIGVSLTYTLKVVTLAVQCQRALKM